MQPRTNAYAGGSPTTIRPVVACTFPGIRRMQITDWATIGICVLAIVAEGRRGSLTAWADAAGLIIAFQVADFVYPAVASEALTPAKAYFVVIGCFVVLIALISWQIQSAAAKLTGPVDRIAGASAGLIVGLACAWGMFQYIAMAYGKSSPLFDHSVFRPMVHDFSWAHAIVAKVHGLHLAQHVHALR